jgi:predicted nucleic acid-binding protein
VGSQAVIVADTSVLFEAWERGRDGDPAVRRRVGELMAEGLLGTTAVTVMELLGGQTTRPARAAWLDGLLSQLAFVLPVSADAARLGAAMIRWRARQSLAVPGQADGLIIGTCLEYGVQVLTLDRRHYEGTPGLELAPVELTH